MIKTKIHLNVYLVCFLCSKVMNTPGVESWKIEKAGKKQPNDNVWTAKSIDKNKTVVEKSLNMEAHIVGGQYANIDDFPHSVYTDIQNNGAEYLCGASILNQRLILTAAHCLEQCLENCTIYLHFGSTSTAIVPPPFIIKVERFSIECDLLKSDVAVMYISRNVVLGEKIKRVILKGEFPSAQPLLASVAGWGVVNDEEKVTHFLKYVQQKVYYPQDCEKIFGVKLLPGTFCATAGKGSYPHHGDSGSALITPDFQQIGLVSYRQRSKGEITIYTNTSYFIHWIIVNCVKLYCHAVVKSTCYRELPTLK